MNGAAPAGLAEITWPGRWWKGMTTVNSVTVSLPVRNVKVSKAFFAELGFRFSPEPVTADSACLVVGGGVRVLLIAADRFRDRINGDAGDGRSAGEILISVPARSEQEVDEIVMRAIVAGGKPWPLMDDRPGYSLSFQDPDGHLWQLTCPREVARLELVAPDSRAAA